MPFKDLMEKYLIKRNNANSRINELDSLYKKVETLRLAHKTEKGKVPKKVDKATWTGETATSFMDNELESMRTCINNHDQHLADILDDISKKTEALKQDRDFFLGEYYRYKGLWERATNDINDEGYNIDDVKNMN